MLKTHAAFYKNKGFSVIKLMTFVSVVIFFIFAIIAWVFIKNFRYYSEPQFAVRKMFDGSVTYFTEDHFSYHGTLIDPQFPTADSTRGPADCVATRSGNSANIAWDEEAIADFSNHGNCWRALQFSIADPTYFRFLYQATNVDNGQDAFVIYVHGDLDNDGIESTFSRRGIGENGERRGVGGVFIQNQLE